MANNLEIYQMMWQEIPVTITYEADWLGLCSHLQLKANQKLPYSETGYRSLYLSKESVIKRGGPVAFATGLLDEMAQSPQWQAYWRDQKQLSLF
ncbi:MAG: hypothetical protein MI974_12865 [Chitinophagales bacterium]|nr:hypothetical protein [Chitinophagales bacterium]